MSNFTVIAVRRDGTHETYTNLDSREAVERRHDALLRNGYTDCRIMCVETRTTGDKQETFLYTHFKGQLVLSNTVKI